MTVGSKGRAMRALMAVTVLVAGCTSDARFKQVTAGIGKDSVGVLAGGATPHHTESYLMGGKHWEIEFYAKPGAAPDDSMPRGMTPVVYADSKVVGTGWSFWESKAKELGIPAPK